MSSAGCSNFHRNLARKSHCEPTRFFQVFFLTKLTSLNYYLTLITSRISFGLFRKKRGRKTWRCRLIEAVRPLSVAVEEVEAEEAAIAWAVNIFLFLFFSLLLCLLLLNKNDNRYLFIYDYYCY
jgi:hypothetical protein